MTKKDIIGIILLLALLLHFVSCGAKKEVVVTSESKEETVRRDTATLVQTGKWVLGKTFHFDMDSDDSLQMEFYSAEFYEETDTATGEQKVKSLASLNLFRGTKKKVSSGGEEKAEQEDSTAAMAASVATKDAESKEKKVTEKKESHWKGVVVAVVVLVLFIIVCCFVAEDIRKISEERNG